MAFDIIMSEISIDEIQDIIEDAENLYDYEIICLTRSFKPEDYREIIKESLSAFNEDSLFSKDLLNKFQDRENSDFEESFYRAIETEEIKSRYIDKRKAYFVEIKSFIKWFQSKEFKLYDGIEEVFNLYTKSPNKKSSKTQNVKYATELIAKMLLEHNDNIYTAEIADFLLHNPEMIPHPFRKL